jgi:hypothetical protein
MNLASGVLLDVKRRVKKLLYHTFFLLIIFLSFILIPTVCFLLFDFFLFSRIHQDAARLAKLILKWNPDGKEYVRNRK